MNCMMMHGLAKFKFIIISVGKSLAGRVWGLLVALFITIQKLVEGKV